MEQEQAVKETYGIGEEVVPQVSEHQPSANVSDERRKVILRESRYGDSSEEASNAYITKSIGEIRDDIKRLTFADKPGLAQAYFKLCYAVGLKNPHKELEKRRSELEFMIADDERCLESIRQKVHEIDDIVEEKRQWMMDSRSVIQEYEAAKSAEEKQMAMEEQQAKQYEAVFFNSENEEEKEQAAQMFRAYQENVKKREKKVREINEKLERACTSFNRFYDAVEARDALKAKYQNEAHAIELDRQVIEDYSEDMKFLASLDDGATRVTELITIHQGQLRQGYQGLISGLHKVYKKQGEAIAKLPDLIAKKKQERNVETKKTVGTMRRRAQEEIKLAKERIKKMSGIA